MVPMIQEHLISTSRIAWPIKALNRLASEEMLVEVLKSCLDFGEVAFDQAKIDKNYDILCYLLDYSLPGYARELAHFLSYHDERVRFAAVEVLVEQEGDGEVADILEPYLTDVSSENTRIHQAAVEAFVKHKWPIKDKSAVMASPIVNQFKIAKEGFLQPI
ncbi:MAG: HEAT repeat domain-containing protein [Bdellovibrionota bacterium]